MRRSLVQVSLLLVFVLAGASQAGARDPGKTIFGYVERVVISAEGLSLKARLDTGALTSSLDAHNIVRFRRGDARYVRFDVRDPATDEYVTLERPLVRNVRIRQHEGPPVRRPVVRMRLCLGHLVREVEVNLTSRKQLIYPLLIGRSAMRSAVIVDPDLTFTSRPKCDLAELAE
ncbi:RimK/LysX family protein [Wenzhouxiangella sp. XN24]|uniref:ATP-dependent zinc protease family protein n=1 Tax=Wenzhouxiangella sp. XN24 TaxID=2713569 RepID=UPI0013EE0786|nr:RimK/LysX family protein [Wenzhouxiangella sp. XN24]NGX16643.1 hypothetical protein [Wenzhouxiangella sp. XN24]